ncbi:MAG: Dihydrolipoamide succinyltransferase component of 2-oxoglutarate dehydrogenase complex [Burkholderiaceae bacterium]|nr:Dihydrolipoamide succinyltransferase component of 2-oxoglutarate dehydrogenase complex [Burkholderiaceae bacterium]
MAVLEVKVPQLSESVAEASLIQWRKQVGESVRQDDNLVDIETDKVVLELPAPGSGVLVQIIKGNGESVVAGETIALIDSEAVASVTAAPAPAPRPSAVSAPAPSAPSVPSASSQPPAPAPSTEIVPAARTQPPPPVSSSRAIAAPINAELANRPEDRVPMSRLRARIAQRLLESQMNTASLTTFNEVNMQPVIDLRNRYKDKFEQEHDVRLGFMSFFVKAAVAALKKYPIMNASIDGNDIVYHGYFDIGIAISSPRGLVVPVMRDADQMSIADIERKIAEFGTQARDGRLTLDDLTGGTFSISNGGVFGSMLSTPIINPPQSAILGIHATKDRPVVENGQIVIRPMNYLALSYDHRLIDGREAVLALVAIKDALEDPARLLLDI